jgi:hypothetical protein
MALQAEARKAVQAMSKEERMRYFDTHAGYYPDSPRLCYAIRIGSTTLMSDDTYDLRLQFDHFIHYGTKRKQNKGE